MIISIHPVSNKIQFEDVERNQRLYIEWNVDRWLMEICCDKWSFNRDFVRRKF